MGNAILKEDKLMANAIKNLQPHLLPEHQKRIALVFSMFETPKLQEYRKDIEKTDKFKPFNKITSISNL